MATLTFDLSSKQDKNTGKKQILVRFQPFVNGKVISMRAKSGLFIDETYWDKKNHKVIIPQSNIKLRETITELRNVRGKLEDMHDYTTDRYNQSDRNSIDSKWLATVINEIYHPETKDNKLKTVYDLISDYLKDSTIADSTKQQHKSTFRIIFRYEAYIQAKENKSFKFDVNTITNNGLNNLRLYMRNEKEYYTQYPELFEEITSQYPDCLKGVRETIKQRNENSIVNAFCRIRTFWYWLLNQEYTANNPFKKFTIGSMHFAAPNALTKEERNDILNADLKDDELKIYRDIFIFQCYIGCRVSDLKRLTTHDAPNGQEWLTYTPQKTKNKGTEATEAKVFLQPTALQLIDKYKDKTTDDRLMPDFDVFKYDRAIKKILEKAGVNREVETRNGKRPLYEIAGSHLARRSFVSIIYNNSPIKDLNAIAISTGHSPNSKSLTTRYCTRGEGLLKEMSASLD